ncbi:hypothetical protein V7x_25700 [Crateriforma conspicua]|uniref:H repeat-associated protein N-terminal domain-containing protein n=1 Tax=Crateriforma conspicua TaxID=2527996 RepID=A0A5C6G052_9PLAN|nr:transposase family protein [Crateriforma conspicua]TWU66998.1 hypothetical protein V7x_25700 [Crateriforma conspicua]
MTGPASLVSNSFVKRTDPRDDRGHSHDLHETTFIALTAPICRANWWADVERFPKAKRQWFERYPKLKEVIPGHDTFGRVSSRLDTGEFLTAVHAWGERFAGALRDKGIATDGKLVRGSVIKRPDKIRSIRSQLS